MGRTPKKFPKVKAISNTLKTQKIKLNSLIGLHNTSSKTLVRSKLKGNVTFNSEDVTYRKNSSQLKILFTSNHKEADSLLLQKF